MIIFDPDKIQEQINEITVEEFGRIIAEVIKEHPSSSNWMLVSWVIEKKTGWSAEHEQVRTLIDRISNEQSMGHDMVNAGIKISDKPKDYVNQDGCHNCQHRFEKQECDEFTEYFCTFAAPKRPLCGSVSMGETFDIDAIPIDEWLNQNGYKDKPVSEWYKPYGTYHRSIYAPLIKEWENWSRERSVNPWGLCNNFLIEKSKQTDKSD